MCVQYFLFSYCPLRFGLEQYSNCTENGSRMDSSNERFGCANRIGRPVFLSISLQLYVRHSNTGVVISLHTQPNPIFSGKH